MTTETICAWMLLGLTGMAAPAGGPSGRTYALIVGGITREPADRAMQDRVMRELRATLVGKAVVEPNCVTMLVPGAADGASTADNLRTAVETHARVVRPADRFIFYYLGHANAVADELRLNLPGPDITHEQLAAWLDGIRAGTQLLIFDCPYAGLAVNALARWGGVRGEGVPPLLVTSDKGKERGQDAPATGKEQGQDAHTTMRIIVCASTAKQAYATRFGLHFVPALTRAETDANHDGRISLLEAFTAAARDIERWYQQMKLLPTETPCLDDNGDGIPSERPWRYETDGADGRRAAVFFLGTVAKD